MIVINVDVPIVGVRVGEGALLGNEVGSGLLSVTTTTEGGIPVGTTGANEGSEEADGCTDEDGAGDGIEVGELVVGAGVGSGIGTFVGDIVGF